MVVAAVVAVERLNAGEPPGVRMLAVIGALLYAMKGVVAVEAAAQGSPAAVGVPLGRVRRVLARDAPGPFARAGTAPRPGAARLAAAGLARGAAGLALVASARLAWRGTGSRWLATALLLPGLSLIVHFGVFDVLAGAWRRAGVDCKPLFRSPLRSTSLGEFWGRRWNLAFSEMTALAVYQPLVRRIGRRPALAASFLGSGLLHELAISVPVRAGYGLPLAYFALHGALVMVEGRLTKAGRPVDRVPWVGRAWTLGWVLVPLAGPVPPPFPRRRRLAADRHRPMRSRATRRRGRACWRSGRPRSRHWSSPPGAQRPCERQTVRNPTLRASGLSWLNLFARWASIGPTTSKRVHRWLQPDDRDRRVTCPFRTSSAHLACEHSGDSPAPHSWSSRHASFDPDFGPLTPAFPRELPGGQVAHGAVRPLLIVVFTPPGRLRPGVVQADEPMAVQAFLPDPPIQ